MWSSRFCAIECAISVALLYVIWAGESFRVWTKYNMLASTRMMLFGECHPLG